MTVISSMKAMRAQRLPVAGVFLALAMLGLFLALRVAMAQDANGPIEYAENGTEPVATFTGVDPEGRTTYWSLVPATLPSGQSFPFDGNGDGDTSDAEDILEVDAADAAHFSISMDGVLNFRFPPNYESAPDSNATDNTYKVVVVSSDDAPGATTDGELPKMAYKKVTVEVTDVDEDGSVSLSTLQPQAGIALNVAGTVDDATDDAAATLKDPDASPAQIEAAKWKWEQSSAMDGPWTLISGETSPSYTPAADVAGMYVRLTATYNDKHDDDKTAMATSAHPVRKAPPGGNSAPVFSAGATDTRRVKENSPSGTAVGKPVTAGDAGDVLTYMLAGDDEGLFSIDRASGQIMTKASLNLEAEGLTDRNAADGIQLQVTVRATDPYGDPDVETAVGTNSDTITVDITVENVNESPTMSVGPTRDSQAENEDTDTGTVDVIDIPTLAYAVTDADADDTIRWTLEGADKDALKITEDATTTADATSSAMLQFKKSPNYEKPIDANKDNVYMVTVVATDKKKLTAMRDVVITVTNADDPGKITFSSEQPKVRIDFTATLTDEDGGEKDVKWIWAAVTGTNCSVVTFAADGSNNIDKAKSDTYTPVTLPTTNVGQCLQATATYTDSNGSGKTMSAISTNPVVDNLDNALPEFREGGDKPVTQAVRYIVESAVAAANVVVDPDGTTESAESPSLDPVMATDPNGSADVLTYTHGGRDKDSFAIASDTGQITVKTGTKLDYEKKNSYMVTVTATDPSQASVTIDVTINVVDVNEPPVIAGDDDLTKEFRENSTSTIQTFRATDPEKRPVYWSLDTAGGTDYPDDGSLTISSSGALSFKSPPDFETPADDGTGNTYTVRVVASDDAPGVGTPIKESYKTFTVRVTNAIEQENIAVSPEYAQVGIDLTASLTAGDVTSTDRGEADWKWSGAVEGTAEDSATASISAPSAPGNITITVTYPALGKDRPKTKSISFKAAPVSNTDPAFPNLDASVSVNEDKPVGTVVGTFKATDSDSEHRSRLTYSDDAASFEVTSNGQLKTTAPLDFETTPSYTVVVTATDPSSGRGTVTVTVTVVDVNEAPTIATGPTRVADWPEDRDIATAVATYTAGEEPDGDSADLVWKLTGADAIDFYIGNQTGGTPGTLTFKEMPDYEKPAASNNVYRVTVEVSDGKLKATRPMTVTVTDVEEEGEVELSTVAPRVAVELTASLEDSDGGRKDVTWKWQRDTTGGPTPDDIPTADCSAVVADGWEDIDEATSESYTPKGGDVGKCLRANASYTDRRGEGKTAMGVSDNAVRVNNDNRAPMFKENDREITETTRKVAENVDAGTLFGDGMDDGVGAGADDDDLDNEEPVEATDPNDDNLTYTLGGPDMVSFGIGRGTGQLMTKAKLDYEAKSSYMVTVTATDPHGLSDSVDVAIKVTDVDEPPEITVGGLVITGKGAIDYEENGMSMVATYMALGPDAASATWSLSGADMGDFNISRAGVLTFRSAPNYETKRIYMVTVNANDGSNDAMKAVTVTVTNVEELGNVDLSSMTPKVGTMLTATLTDPDGDVTETTWQWSRSMTMGGTYMDISGATAMAYTPVADDDGYYLMVKVMYTDGHGSGKSAMARTSMAVTDVNEAPMFGAESATRNVAENTAAGQNIGAAVTATDGDGDDLTYTLGGTDAASFDIGESTGQLTTKSPLDFETKPTYTVTVTADDGNGGHDDVTVTINVTNVDEDGAVALDATAPQVDTAITATLSDPDGSVTSATWQWSKSTTADGSFDAIAGAISDTYTPVEADVGMYLRATASYTDGEGSGKTAMATTENAVAAAGDPLVNRYDANKNGEIEKSEVITAINEYLDGAEGAPSKADVIKLINLYLGD